ncbi:CobW family GTP-binding protein [Pseudodonghicola xiamenensis]|uniref:Cobalamin biosynthesis protein CobW n=1 Tax=Pseudodonghicola xiamenensis TaxID=337702 RepID=A0A8J3HB46_9RHOB|nr:GTP-binding protein [Pseudodonghicola xiamenensis]GHG99335.1 cobalamin biosynthesis protein CobW [Pseudodonghicola xiamenensis]
MTPVVLLTGFLGSGKTTLLQRLLTDPTMQGAAVLINEFGEVGLDHHLLDRIDDTVVLLKSGCICCTVRGEVAEALANLESLRTRGEIAFDRVVIETTGLADPYPVLQTLTAHPVLRSHFVNGGVLTTVDAVNAARQVDHRDEAVRQIAAADRVILTKTDLADPAMVVNLRNRLSRLNPAATVVSAAEPVGTILGGFGPATFMGSFGTAVHVCDDRCDHSHDHGHDHRAHHHADLGVTSFSLVIEEAIDWTMFGTWLTLLLHRYGDRIFRVKGILVLEGEDRPIAIHGVQHLVHAPTHMDHWPEGPRHSRIVFILEGLSPDLIRRSFAAFTGLARVRTAA